MNDAKYARMDAKLQEILKLANDLRWEISEDDTKRCPKCDGLVVPCPLPQCSGQERTDE